MLHTLKESVIPHVAHWLDWLMQSLGFFSFSIAHQANALIHTIHDNLSHAWLSPEEHTQIQHERQGWQTVLTCFNTHTKPPSLRLLYTLEKKINKQRIHLKLRHIQQHRRNLDQLNDPSQWECWETLANDADGVFLLKNQWQSFCDVGGIGLQHATSLWHALKSLETYFEHIAAYKAWRFLWLNKASKMAYHDHTKKNLSAIANLEKQLCHYLWFSMQSTDHTLTMEHPLCLFIDQLHQLGINQLKNPSFLLDAVNQKQIARDTLDILAQTHHQDKLRKHHAKLHHRLDGVYFHKRWLCLPRSLCEWLSDTQSQVKHTSSIQKLHALSANKTTDIIALCRLLSTDIPTQSTQGMLEMIDQQNQLASTLTQWQQVMQLAAKPRHTHQDKHAMAYAKCWLAWLKDSLSELKQQRSLVIFHLKQYTKNSKHQWLLDKNIQPYAAILAKTQQHGLSTHHNHCDQDDLARKDTDGLLWAANAATKINDLNARKQPTANALRAVLTDWHATKHTSKAIQDRLWQRLTASNQHLKQAFLDCIDQLITIPTQHRPISSIINQMACYIELFHIINEHAWLAQQLSSLVLMYSHLGALSQPIGLTWLTHMQGIETIIKASLATVIFAGCELQQWLDRLITTRKKGHTQHYQCLSSQLFTYAGKQILSTWIDRELQAIDHQSLDSIKLNTNDGQVGLWYQQTCLRMTTDAHQPAQKISISPSDQAIIDQHASKSLPLHPILQARFTLFSTKRHIDNHFDNKEKTLSHIASLLQITAMLLASVKQAYPLHHMRVFNQLLNQLGKIRHQHTTQPVDQRYLI